MRALQAERDAILSQIAELKRQMRQGDLPEAKRRRHLSRRLTFKVTQTGLAPVPQPSELVGRREAVAEVRSAAACNYMGRGREDPAQHGFLSFNGHVRTGKTRMGEEVPRIIDEMRGAGSDWAWAQAVYLDIRFQGGAQFAPDLDRGHAPGPKIEARIAAAAGSLFDEDGTRVDISRMTHAQAATIDVHAVFGALVGEYGAKGKVLPIVLHLDEYGLYVESSGDPDAFKRLLLHVGTLMSQSRRTDYFLVPVATGTSYRDVDFGALSAHRLWCPRLRLLSPDESVQAARSFWERSGRADAFPIASPRSTDGQRFAAALADAGGYPGYIAMLCDLGFRADGDYSQALCDQVTNYSDRLERRPPPKLWARVVRKMLTRQVMSTSDVVEYEARDGSAASVSVLDLVDDGRVMPNWTGPRELRVSVPFHMLRCWLREAGVFDAARADEASFPRFHAAFMAARVAAIYHETTTDRLSFTLRDVLSGAKPSGADVLRRAVRPAAAGGDVPAACTLAGDTYVFFQHEWSSSASARTTGEIASAARQLEIRLTTGSAEQERWKGLYARRRVVFVGITGAPVEEDEALAVDGTVLYIGREELVEHMGAEFAGRSRLTRAWR